MAMGDVCREAGWDPDSTDITSSFADLLSTTTFPRPYSSIHVFLADIPLQVPEQVYTTQTPSAKFLFWKRVLAALLLIPPHRP